MLSTGLLADGAREYSDTFDRKWLVTSYEAGDVVLHNPFAVSSSDSNKRERVIADRMTDSRLDHELRPKQRDQSRH